MTVVAGTSSGCDDQGGMEENCGGAEGRDVQDDDSLGWATQEQR